jgi:hypothetical protein
MAVSEFLEGLVEQTKGFLAREAELAGFDGELGGERLEAADLLRAKQARRLLIDVAATAGNGAQDAFALKVLEGARYGIGVDTELGGQFPDRGQRIVVVESAGGDGMADLVLNLEVDGNAGSGMDAEEHGWIGGLAASMPSVLIQ